MTYKLYCGAESSSEKKEIFDWGWPSVLKSLEKKKPGDLRTAFSAWINFPGLLQL